MQSIEVRRRARAEHDSIRKRLARLEALAVRIEGGDAGGAVHVIHDEINALIRELRSHLDWEDGGVSAMRGTDTRDSERAVRLRSSHDELRIVLDFCRHFCGGEIHPVLLAGRVRDLVALLRRTLEVEEEATIDRAVPRDGAVTIGPPSSWDVFAADPEWNVRNEG